MKTLVTFALLVSAAFVVAEDKKFDASKLEGKWLLTGGKKAGTEVNDDAKKGWYEISKDTIKIYETTEKDAKAAFTIKYSTDGKKSPAEIDMEITAATMEQAKGMKSKGIIMVDGDTMKLCYYPMDADKRPAKWDDDKAYCFTFKREKKDK